MEIGVSDHLPGEWGHFYPLVKVSGHFKRIAFACQLAADFAREADPVVPAAAASAAAAPAAAGPVRRALGEFLFVPASSGDGQPGLALLAAAGARTR